MWTFMRVVIGEVNFEVVRLQELRSVLSLHKGARMLLVMPTIHSLRVILKKKTKAVNAYKDANA